MTPFVALTDSTLSHDIKKLWKLQREKSPLRVYEEIGTTKESLGPGNWTE